MIGTQHNPLLQGGGWLIESEPPEHKKDRAQAVVYRAPGPRRRRSSQWTPSQQYAYKNNRWIAEVVSDRPEDLAKQPHERPGIVRLLQLWLCSGGLLLDQLDELGDALTQAVVVSHFMAVKRQVVANGHVVSAERCQRLVIRAGGPDVVAAALEPVTLAATAGFSSFYKEGNDSPFLVGSGDARHYPAAVDYVRCLGLLEPPPGRTELLYRLNLEGWENPRGRRRWNTHNLPEVSS